MRKVGKRFKAASEKVDSKKYYNIKEAVELIKKTATAKFDETIEAHVRLGVDSRRADQQVRATVIMPHGTGKNHKILVFAKGEKVKEALSFGADYAGLDELVTKIQDGWLDFDVVVAMPDTMTIVSKLGKILGPRGLMPNPKTDTLTQDIKKAIKEIKSGKIEFHTDKGGILHVGFAKASFDSYKIEENFKAFIEAVIKSKPSATKGVYLKNITIKSTMGPGIKIDSTVIDK